MFTFVDGDCTLDGGSGVLVVTGTLTLNGNPNFKGIILVLGDGVLIRNGGGNGDILGGITIAKFGRTSGNFESPTFHTNGGAATRTCSMIRSRCRGISSGTNVSASASF